MDETIKSWWNDLPQNILQNRSVLFIGIKIYFALVWLYYINIRRRHVLIPYLRNWSSFSSKITIINTWPVYSISYQDFESLELILDYGIYAMILRPINKWLAETHNFLSFLNAIIKNIIRFEFFFCLFILINFFLFVFCLHIFKVWFSLTCHELMRKYLQSDEEEKY